MHECSENFVAFEQEWWKAMFHTIANVVPYLSPEKRTELFRLIESPSCTRHFTTPQRDFVALLKAVVRQEPLLMVRYSKKLLEESTFENAELVEYIVSAGILGNLSSGNRDDARSLWMKYGKILPYKNRNSMAMRLLVGHLIVQQIQ